MDPFASLVPNHEYGRSACCYCFCFRELSVIIISAVCVFEKKKKRSHKKLLALHCSPQLVFCGGHFLMQPLHNNSARIGMGNDQSYEPQHPVSKASFVVVWLSLLRLSVVVASRRSPSNDVRKISASFTTTLALLAGTYLLTNARKASNPSPSLLVKTIFSAFPLQKRISAW